jgi:protein TonB
MRNLIKKFKEERKIQRKTNVIAVILALFIHTLLFIGIAEFKNAGTTIFEPIQPEDTFMPVVIQPTPQKPLPIVPIEKLQSYSRPGNHSVPINVPNPPNDSVIYDIEKNIDRIILETGGSSPSFRGNPAGKISIPVVIKKAIPEYPEIAVSMGLEDNIEVICTLDINGKISKVRLGRSSGYDILDKAALNSAKNCIFTPAIQNGKFIEVEISITYKFSLGTVVDFVN